MSTTLPSCGLNSPANQSISAELGAKNVEPCSSEFVRCGLHLVGELGGVGVVGGGVLPCVSTLFEGVSGVTTLRDTLATGRLQIAEILPLVNACSCS